MPVTPNRQILIVGDSHTAALERGRAQLQAQGALPPGIDWRIVPLGSGARMNTAFWAEEGGAIVLQDPQYRARLPRLPPGDPRPDAVGVCMPLWSGRVMRDLILGGMTPFGVEGRGKPLSAALVRRLVTLDQRHILGLVQALQARGLPVFAIEPPGIFREYRLLVHVSGAEALALQRHIRALQAAELAAIGVPVVPLPPDATDAEGFMRAALRSEDPNDSSHASGAFGVARLQQIAAFLAEAPAGGIPA